MQTEIACQTCSLCDELAMDLTECIECGLLCARCVTVCPHDLTDLEVLRLTERELAAAQTRLARAETMLTLGTETETYWERQRAEAGQEVSDLLTGIAFRRRCMAQEAALAA